MNRYYFMGFIVVDGCNPNGDPTEENLPRIDYEGTEFFVQFYLYKVLTYNYLPGGVHR